MFEFFKRKPSNPIFKRDKELAILVFKLNEKICKKYRGEDGSFVIT